MNIINSLLRIFRSSRTTIIVIAVLLVLFFLGIAVPQKALFQSRAQYDAWRLKSPVLSSLIENLKLNDIAVSPLTLFFLALFFVNLVTVLAYRVPIIFRKAYLTGKITTEDVAHIAHDPGVRVIEVGGISPGNLLETVTTFLSDKQWKILMGATDGQLLAVKNRYSPIGFVFFHFSFLLCLIGGLMIMYTRFAGNITVTEGQGISCDSLSFRQIKREPKILKDLPPLGIFLQKVVPRYEQDVPTDLEVRMKVMYENRETNETVRVNQPVKRGAFTVISEQIGVSPLFVLKTADNTMIDGGYVTLNVLNGNEDSFEFEGRPYKIYVRFYPDYAEEDGKSFSLSKNILNPVVHLKIKGDEGIIAEGTIPMSGSISFSGMILAFEDIRYWVDFLVIREYGAAPLFLGFFLGAVGLVMRLIFHQKTLRVCATDEHGQVRLHVLGRSEYFQFSFSEETDALIYELSAVLQKQQ